MRDLSLLEELLSKLDIPYNSNQISQFSDYFDLLIEWNSFMNLTAITELNDVIIKHFIDSILACKFYDLSHGSIIDIGTGAGFPGIPIKILNPDCNITLLDSLNKRIVFLNNVINNLSLDNVNCIHGRAEDFAHNNLYREKFDFCVSRAVSNLSVLSEYCIPFLKVNGIFISYKSDSIEEELNNSYNALKILFSKIIDIKSIEIPDTDIIRKIVIIEKCNNTNNKFPRKAGIPSKNPL